MEHHVPIVCNAVVRQKNSSMLMHCCRTHRAAAHISSLMATTQLEVVRWSPWVTNRLVSRGFAKVLPWIFNVSHEVLGRACVKGTAGYVETGTRSCCGTFGGVVS